MVERPRIRIEIPIPQWRPSPRLRFSLRSLLLVTAIIAVGSAVYRYARTVERAEHSGGQFELVLSSPTVMEVKSIRCREFLDIYALASSPKIRFDSHAGEETARDLWPPSVWLTRADWSSADLEKTSSIACGGTLEVPVFAANVAIQPGDRVFFDYGRRPALGSQSTTAGLPATPISTR